VWTLYGGSLTPALAIGVLDRGGSLHPAIGSSSEAVCNASGKPHTDLAILIRGNRRGIPAVPACGWTARRPAITPRANENFDHHACANLIHALAAASCIGRLGRGRRRNITTTVRVIVRLVDDEAVVTVCATTFESRVMDCAGRQNAEDQNEANRRQ